MIASLVAGWSARSAILSRLEFKYSFCDQLLHRMKTPLVSTKGCAEKSGKQPPAATSPQPGHQTDSAFGTLDWGRGNWTYKNRWYWGSASSLLDGEPIGWNLGYGFSDRTPATENMIFYQGTAHKLDEVTFHMDTGKGVRGAVL